MNNGRDCVHGRQVGKCDTCELIDAEQRIMELEAEVEALKPLARCCLWGAFVWNDHNFDHLQNFCKGEAIMAGIENIEQANAFISEKPAQHLAEIKAQAFKQGFESCINAAVKMGMIDKDGEFANQLRHQAKGE